MTIQFRKAVKRHSPGRVTVDRWLAEAAWSRGALEAATALGFPAPIRSIDAPTGEPMFWIDLAAARAWLIAFNRVMPKVLPSALSPGAESNGISLAELREAFRLSPAKFDAIASAFLFPTLRIRERADSDGLRRTELFGWRHEVDRWIDLVRAVRVSAEARTAPPPAA